MFVPRFGWLVGFPCALLALDSGMVVCDVVVVVVDDDLSAYCISICQHIWGL